MFGPEDLQRKAGGSGYGLPGSDYTSPTAPSESAVQRPTIADVTDKPTPQSQMIYGDLNISVIDELPPGRKPINTIHRFLTSDCHVERKNEIF